MPRGRPRLGRTEEERADARRAQVRLNVQAFRQRQKDGSSIGATTGASKGFTIIIEDPSRRRRRNEGTNHNLLATDKSKNTLADRGKPAVETPEEDRRLSGNSCSLQALDSDQGPTGACHNVQLHAFKAGRTRRPLGAPYQGQLYKGAFSNALCECHNAEPSKRPLGVLSEIDQGQAYKGAVYNALFERYKPDPQLRSDDSMVKGGYRQGTIPYSCLSWLDTAITGASLNASDVLADAMLSMALSVIGSQRNDMQILVTAQRTYQKALAKIKRGLATLKAGDALKDLSSGYLPLACFACAWVELMANRSIESFNRHMDGIATLIESCDPTILGSPALQALFWEHRGVYIMFSFLNRRPDFYSKPKWVAYFDARAQEFRYSYFETLISIACQIPVLLEQYDTGLDTSTHALGQLVRSAAQVDKLLGNWKADLESAFPIPLTTETPSLSPTPFPTRIDFPSFGVALSLLYYYAFRSYIYLLVLDVASDLSSPSPCLTSKATQHALTCASTILASMSYCQDSSSGLVGKGIALFPFDSAWQVFLKLHSPTAGRDYSSELAFCETTAQTFQQLGLTLVRDRLEEQEYCLRRSPGNANTSPLPFSDTGASISSEATAVEPTGGLSDLIDKRDSMESWERWDNMFDKGVGAIEHIHLDDENDSTSWWDGGRVAEEEECINHVVRTS